MNKAWILLLWGAPAAGKSTLARHIVTKFREQHGHELCHLGTDRLNQSLIGPEFDRDIRDSLYGGILEMTAGLSSRGRSILVEGTFLRRDRRQALRTMAEQNGAAFLSVMTECRLSLRLARNSHRDSSELVPPRFLEQSHQLALNARPEADFVFDTELMEASRLADFLLGQLARETVRN